MTADNSNFFGGLVGGEQLLLKPFNHFLKKKINLLSYNIFTKFELSDISSGISTQIVFICKKL